MDDTNSENLVLNVHMELQYPDDFHETLSPEEYERYLVLRKQKESGIGGRGNVKGGWVGFDPPSSKINLQGLLRKLDEAYNRLSKRLCERLENLKLMSNNQKVIEEITNTEMEDMATTNEAIPDAIPCSPIYTVVQLCEMFAVSSHTIGAWLREGYISTSAVESKGVYKKDVIDGWLLMVYYRRIQANVGGNRAKKSSRTNLTAIEKKSAQQPLVCAEATVESYMIEFWNRNESLAVKVLTAPEPTRAFILECVDAVIRFKVDK